MSRRHLARRFVAAAAVGLAIALPAELRAEEWSEAVSLGLGHGRLAVGDRVHVVGHSGGNLVHRSSEDDGVTWSAETIIAPAGGNFPMQYGGLAAQGSSVFLLTAAGDMGGSVQHLDFRRSDDDGLTWTSPVRLTLTEEQRARRANIVVSGDHVHVTGGAGNPDSPVRYRWYFRSANGGVTWDPPMLVDDGEGGDGWIAVDGSTVHIAYDKAAGTGGGRTHYLRSVDDGANWTAPIFIGEDSAESDGQARTRTAAADGRVFVVWQREGSPQPAGRLGYARSEDGGASWLTAEVLPGDAGIDRNHQHVAMVAGGALHLAWLHGPSGQATSATGYRLSTDYGATWGETEIANPTAAGNVSASLVASPGWVHLGVDPRTSLQHTRRPVDPGPGPRPDDAGPSPDATGGAPGDGSGGGCGCAAGGGSPGAPAALWLAALLWRRRRRG